MREGEAIKKIQRLHRQHRGLNIHAVKRHSPELLDFAFTQKPFLGWKRLLEKAGLSYDDIDFELQEWVVCKFCGKELQLLPNHLRTAHGCTGAEYLEEFPGSDLRAETARQQIRQKPSIPRYWEPIWSREHIIDRVWHYYEIGEPVNGLALAKKDKALHRQIEIYFTRMVQLLDLLGIAGEQTILQKSRFGKGKDAAVLEAIRVRHDSGLPMTAKDLCQGENIDNTLHKESIRRFGSWENAIQTAGIETKGLGLARTPFAWTDALVLEGIRKRSKAGQSLERVVVDREEHHLVRAAGERFGSWYYAVEAANLSIDSAKPRAAFKDGAAVLKAIRSRIRLKRPLSRAQVLEGKNTYACQTLVSRAEQEFSTWSKAVTLAKESLRERR